MNVLSLFDGLSAAQIALDQLSIRYDNYFASEIDKYAIQITQKNYPNTIQLGNIRNINGKKLPNIDLLIGGSPCQGFSFAGKQLNFNDERSKLFFEYVRLLNECNPKYFLLENVKMKKEYQNIISKHIGVDPIEINSVLFSAQNRKRLYWTNIKIDKLPEDRGILLKDIIEKGVVNRDKSYCIDASYYKGTNIEQYLKKKIRLVVFTERRTEEAKKIRKEFRRKFNKDFCPRREKELVPRKDGKVNCLTKTFSIKEHTLIDENFNYRKLTPLECERLQTINTIYNLEVVLWSDQIRNYVNAVEKNHRLQKLVLSVEKNELGEFAKFVEKNMKQSNQQIKFIVLQNAGMQIQKQIKKCINTNQEEKFSNVNIVEKKIMSNYYGIEEDFVIQNVFTNIIQEKITIFGKEGLHQKDKNSYNQKNGNAQLKLYGKEIIQLVNTVGITMENQEIEKCIYTTLYHLNTKSIDQMLIILYWFAKNVIDLFTQNKIQTKTLLLKYSFENSYTEGVSNTQRYKMLGNSFTVEVIKFILKNIKK